MKELLVQQKENNNANSDNNINIPQTISPNKNNSSDVSAVDLLNKGTENWDITAWVDDDSNLFIESTNSFINNHINWISLDEEEYIEFQMELEERMDCDIISDFTDYFFAKDPNKP